jgi:hypothetical protein
MPEVELQCKFPTKLLILPGYKIEIEKNNTKARVAMVSNTNIKYVRTTNFKGAHINLMIIDILQGASTRIININRSFPPQDNEGQREKFQYQVELIKIAMPKIQIY